MRGLERLLRIREHAVHRVPPFVNVSRQAMIVGRVVEQNIWVNIVGIGIGEAAGIFSRAVRKIDPPAAARRSEPGAIAGAELTDTLEHKFPSGGARELACGATEWRIYVVIMEIRKAQRPLA